MFDGSNHKNESAIMARDAAAILNATFLTPDMPARRKDGGKRAERGRCLWV